MSIPAGDGRPPRSTAPGPSPSRAAEAAADAGLTHEALTAMHEHLHAVAELTVTAVSSEVPGYRDTLDGPERANLERAVELALRGFLLLAAGARGSGSSSPMAPALDGAYALGRGEARGGRSMDALLAAYRVGARVSWRELANLAVAAGLPAGRLVAFAELVFAYIDELSAASVAGHADELATTGRVRQRYLERLGHALVVGSPVEQLATAAERADWDPPAVLVAVVLPESQVRSALARVDPRTLQPTEDVPGLAAGDAVLLVPGGTAAPRARLLRALASVPCVVGPPRPWVQVSASFRRALRARELAVAGRMASGAAGGSPPGAHGASPPGAQGATAEHPRGPLDTEEHLPELVVGADPAALADLRARALAPLAGLRPAAAARLVETLRAWLLHHGRREGVAAELFVHPQTVRYRMGQLRELFGDRLDDPRTVLELTIALGTGPAPDSTTQAGW